MKYPKDSRRKEITKINADINIKETKQTIVKINKDKTWFFEKINRQTISQTRQEKKGEESYQQNQKLKWSNHNSQHGNTKDHKRLPSATICQ